MAKALGLMSAFAQKPMDLRAKGQKATASLRRLTDGPAIHNMTADADSL